MKTNLPIKRKQFARYIIESGIDVEILEEYAGKELREDEIFPTLAQKIKAEKRIDVYHRLDIICRDWLMGLGTGVEIPFSHMDIIDAATGYGFEINSDNDIELILSDYWRFCGEVLAEKIKPFYVI